MATGLPQFGSKLRIVTQDNCIWEGVFSGVDTEANSVSLTDISLINADEIKGNAQRVEKKIKYKVFYGRDMKDISCVITKPEQSSPHALNNLAPAADTSGSSVSSDADIPSTSCANKQITSVNNSAGCASILISTSASSTVAVCSEASSWALTIFTSSSTNNGNNVVNQTSSDLSSAPVLLASNIPNVSPNGQLECILAWLSNLQLQYQRRMFQYIQQQHQHTLNTLMSLINAGETPKTAQLVSDIAAMNCLPVGDSSGTDSTIKTEIDNMAAISTAVVEPGTNSSTNFNEHTLVQNETSAKVTKKRVTYKEPEIEEYQDSASQNSHSVGALRNQYHSNLKARNGARYDDTTKHYQYVGDQNKFANRKIFRYNSYRDVDGRYNKYSEQAPGVNERRISICSSSGSSSGGGFRGKNGKFPRNKARPIYSVNYKNFDTFHTEFHTQFRAEFDFEKSNKIFKKLKTQTVRPRDSGSNMCLVNFSNSEQLQENDIDINKEEVDDIIEKETENKKKASVCYDKEESFFDTIDIDQRTRRNQYHSNLKARNGARYDDTTKHYQYVGDQNKFANRKIFRYNSYRDVDGRYNKYSEQAPGVNERRISICSSSGSSSGGGFRGKNGKFPRNKARPIYSVNYKNFDTFHTEFHTQFRAEFDFEKSNEIFKKLKTQTVRPRDSGSNMCLVNFSNSEQLQENDIDINKEEVDDIIEKETENKKKASVCYDKEKSFFDTIDIDQRTRRYASLSPRY